MTAVEWLIDQIKNEDHHTEGELGNSCIDVNTLLMLCEQAKQMEKEQNTNVQNVTRFEVIDHSGDKPGRILVKHGVNIELSIQDDGKTLKIFLTDETEQKK